MAVAVVLFACPVRIVNDSHYTLLAAESLIDTGTMRLDAAFAHPLDRALYPGMENDQPLPYQVVRHDGHVLPYYPPGSAVLSVPFVAAARLLGVYVAGADGRYRADVEVELQRLLAALLMGALAALMFRTAALLLPPLPSALLSLGATFASPVLSTASRALWSDTWGVLVLGVVVHLLVKDAARARPPSAPLLATLLSVLFFVKPTYAISILATVGCVAATRPARLPLLVATGAMWLGAFAAWSRHVYGTLLPPYYSETVGDGRLAARLVGTLASPSRGLLVFCPIVLPILAGVLRAWPRLPSRPLAAVALWAVALHVLMTANHDVWWAGVCYGPRYMTPLVPWFFLLALLWRHARGAAPGAPFARAAVALALLASIAMNAIGALDPATVAWNHVPAEVDEGRVMSWRDPQFLAGLRRARP